MKRILFFIGCLLSLCPIQADTVTSQTTAATEYSLVVGDWTYITNASEFLLLVNQCADPNVGEKKVRFACDLEFTVTNKNLKYFNGTLDGMGANIKNFTYAALNNDAAFIQELKGTNSEVKNFRFENPVVKSKTSVAIVVNKVTATTASINNIYVYGGYVTSDGSSTPPAGIIANKISTGTTISNCMINKTEFYALSKVATNGLFFTGFTDNGPTVYSDDINTNYPVSNCCAVILSGYGFHYSIPDPPGAKKWNGKDFNLFYYVNSNKVHNYVLNFLTLTSKTLEELTSGNNVFNNSDLWVYTTDSIPRPAGNLYWVPGKTYERTVGYMGSIINAYNNPSNKLKIKANCTPLQYGRAFDNTPLKITEVVNVGSNAYGREDKLASTDCDYYFHDAVYNSYVGNDEYTYCDDWTGKPFYNPVTVIGEDFLYPFNEAYYFALPRGVTKVEGYSFKNRIRGINNKEEFRTAGNWIYDNDNGVLYLNSNEGKYLVTSVWRKGLSEINIDGEKCDTIINYAFDSQSNLQTLYVNTWFPVGTTEFKPIQMIGTAKTTFNERENEIEVYIKDGTQDMSIIGKSLLDGDSYKDRNCKWTEFYSENEDVPNRLFQYYPIKRNAAGLSTVMLGYAAELPSDCKAWVAKSISNGQLELLRVTGSIIPAKLPVLISYETTEGTINLIPYSGGDAPSATDYEGSIFKGSIDPGGQKMNSSEMMSNFYTLSRPSGDTSYDNVGFYPFHPADNILPSYVAWISTQDVPTTSAKLSMTFLEEEDGIATGLHVLSGVSEQGTSAPLYNLSGQRVGSDYKGIIVKNGRKYLVK